MSAAAELAARAAQLKPKAGTTVVVAVDHTTSDDATSKSRVSPCRFCVVRTSGGVERAHAEL